MSKDGGGYGDSAADRNGSRLRELEKQAIGNLISDDKLKEEVVSVLSKAKHQIQCVEIAEKVMEMVRYRVETRLQEYINTIVRDMVIKGELNVDVNWNLQVPKKGKS